MPVGAFRGTVLIVLSLMIVGPAGPALGQEPAVPEVLSTFTRRIPITLDNSAGAALSNRPVVLPATSLEAVATDLNLANCALAAQDADGQWNAIPYQVDEIDEAVGRELSFLASVPAEAQGTYYLYYNPEGRRSSVFMLKTRTAQDWVPPNIGWESALIAYRTYHGQFDFFAKKMTGGPGPAAETYILPTIGDKDYHKEAEWGMDPLLVGRSSGIGGLTLYLGEQGYRLQNPEGQGSVRFDKEVLAVGAVRAAVEVTVGDFVPGNRDVTARITCLIYGGHQESEIRVSVMGAPEGALPAPGLTKLPTEETCFDREKGYFGNWGQQNIEIGPIGMALLLPPGLALDPIEADGDHRVPCPLSDGVLRYHILGDWMRSRVYATAPGIAQWQERLEALAAELSREVPVAVGTVETLG